MLSLFHKQFLGWLLDIVSHQIQKQVLVLDMPGLRHSHLHGLHLLEATVAVLGPGGLLPDPVLGSRHPGVHVGELLAVAPAGHAED